jgi:hypothetical protein
MDLSMDYFPLKGFHFLHKALADAETSNHLHFGKQIARLLDSTDKNYSDKGQATSDKSRS